MEDYRPNSHKAREEQKTQKAEKVISGSVRTDHRSGTMSKISENFDSAKSYIIGDIIIPAIKAAISDMVANGIDILLYGEARHSTKNSSKVSYDRFYKNSSNTGTSYNCNTYNYKDILFDNRGEAEVVLSKMEEIITIYGMVSVADLYDLVGITGKYTDNKYGWTDLCGAQTVYTREGYMLKLPKAVPLD